MREILYFLLSHYSFLATLYMAVVAFVWRLPKRAHFVMRLVMSVAMSLVLYGFWSIDYGVSIFASAVYYLVVYLTLCLLIYICFDVNLASMLFCAIGAYALQHIAYQMQAIVWYFEPDAMYTGFGVVLTLLLYPAVYVLYWILALRRMNLTGREHCKKAVLGGITILFEIAAVLLSVSLNQLYSGFPSMSEILCRLLFILVSVLVLVLLGMIFTTERYYRETELLHNMLETQRLQYEQFKESMDMINIKCHDIRHQLQTYGAVFDKEDVQELISSIRVYDSALKTGNAALDIVLAEKNMLFSANEIEFTCIVDGNHLSFLTDAEIYALFGNALDNAFHACLQLPAKERAVSLLVTERAGNLIIECRNPYVGEIKLKDGLPETIREGDIYHGFGMKSMKFVADRSNGLMRVHTEDGIFEISIVISIKKEDNR